MGQRFDVVLILGQTLTTLKMLGVMLALFVLQAGFYSPAILAADSSQVSLSPKQANLKLTHFLFAQVIESFLEEGDQFAVESIFGNGERTYQYLLEKKFFVAFMKEWQHQLERTDITYQSSLQIFRAVLAESDFLKTNSFYLTATLGISSDFAKISEQQLMKAGAEAYKKTFAKDQLPLLHKNGLSPFQVYPVNLGYARVPLLLRILASESQCADEKRALLLLDEMARFIAYEKDDRKTIVWMTAFFLQNPSEAVVKKAQTILENIGFNETVNILSEARWFALGGRYLWSQREKVVEGLSLLGQTKKAQRLKQWIAFLSVPTIKVARTAKDAAVFSTLSLYRYLKTLDPAGLAGGVSIGVHIGFLNYFFSAPQSESSFEVELKEAMKSFAMPAEAIESLNLEWTRLNERLKKYAGTSKYAVLRKFDSTPLDVLNGIKPSVMKDVDSLLKEGKEWLNENQSHKKYSFNYGSYLLQDEYYRSLSSTRVKDLRLISMAEAIKNIRIQEVKELLAKHKVQFLNDLNYSGLREVLYQTQQRLQSLHSFYYSRDSRFLIREMLGEGGNCVAIALLHLSVLSAVLGEGDWQLGLVFKPSHILLSAFSTKQDVLIELDSFSELRLSRYDSEVYHPDLVVASSLGPAVASNYLIHKPEKSGPSLVGETMSEFGIMSGELSEFAKALSNPFDDLKAGFKNLINNPIVRVLKAPLKNEKNERNDIPEFAIQGTNKNDQSSDSNEDSGSNSSPWLKELNKALLGIFSEKPKDLGKVQRELQESRFRLSVDSEFGVLVEYHVSLASPQLIPLLEGKMGSFMAQNYNRDYSLLRLELYQTAEQREFTTRLKPSDFLKMVLLSLQKQGEALGAVLKDQSFESQIEAYFKESNLMPNAGMVRSNEKLKPISDWFLRVSNFKIAVEAFIDPYEAVPTGRQPINYHNILYDFAMAAGYPSKTWVANGSRGLHLENTAFLSSDVLTTVLLRGRDWPDDKLYVFGSFQSLFLFDRIFTFKEFGLSSRLSQFSVKPFLQESPEAFLSTQVLTPSGWKAADSLTTDYLVTASGKLPFEYLSSDPREVRANLLLQLAPLGNFPKRDHKKLSKLLVERLDADAKQWTFELPQIEVQPCHHEKPKFPVNVNLPKISNEQCTSLKNTTEGVICIESGEGNSLSAMIKKGQNSSPVCLDPKSDENYKVTYSKKKTLKSGSTGASVLIPFENFLSLLSLPYLEDLGNLDALTSGLPLIEVILKSLFNEKKFPDSIAQHLVENKSYYLKFWSQEMESFCGVLKKSESSFDRAYVPGLDESTNRFLKANKSKVFYELPHGGGNVITTRFYEMLREAKVCKPSTDAKKTPEPTPESTPVVPPTPPIKNRLHIHQ